MANAATGEDGQDKKEVVAITTKTPNQKHKKILYSSGTFRIFFDNGSDSCWISKSLAARTNSSPIRVPATRVKGVGSGPTVNYDCEIIFSFPYVDADGSQRHTSPISLFCGILPDECTPGDLLIGRSLHVKLGILLRDNYRIEFTRPGALSPLTTLCIDPIRELAATIHMRKDCVLSIEVSLTETDARKASKTIPETATTLPGPAELQRYQATFPEVFQPSGRRVARTRRTMHSIDTGDAAPWRSGSNRYSPLQALAIRLFVEEGVRDGVIEKSTSPWGFRALAVPKGGTKLPRLTADQIQSLPTLDRLPDGVVVRICVDYRPLNKLTKKHAYPLPNVNEEIHKAAGYKLYNLLDLRDGFWQIPMHPASAEKTAFVTPHGHYQFNVMPFGLTNAPATFQKLIDELLDDHRGYTAGLIDDICIFADNREDLDKRTIAVLTTLNTAGLVLQLRKCKWLQTEVALLGMLISANGIRSDPDKIKVIKNWPDIRTITDLRGFLGATGWHRAHIENYAHKALPLTAYLSGSPKSGTKLQLSPEARKAVDDLKTALTSAPLLVPFLYSLPVVLHVDASLEFIGAALYQPHAKAFSRSSSLKPSILHPVAYFSSKLTPTQQRYSAQEREALALTSALYKWRSWIEGLDITVVTDHESLTRLRTQKDPTTRLLRFLDKIEHFDPNIIWKKGSSNFVADWLSRPPADTAVHVAGDSPADPIALDDIQPSSSSRPHNSSSGPALESLTTYDILEIALTMIHGRPSDSRLPMAWLKKNFAAVNGYLYLLKDDKMLKVLVQADLHQELTRLHQNLGHCSAGLLLREAEKRFWSPDMRLDVSRVCLECTTCQLYRKPPQLAEELRPTPPAEPFARWGMDFTGPITHGGQWHIATAIDYATSWAFAIPVLHATADAAIEVLRAISWTFGSPAEIIADNGGAFAAQKFNDTLKLDNIHRHEIAPYRPQSNGKVERFHRTLKAILYPMLHAQPQTSFPTLVQNALNIYKHRPLEHGFTPYFLAFGCQPPEPGKHQLYERELTMEEEHAANKFRAQNLQDLDAIRHNVNSMRQIRERARTVLQSQKAATRHFQPGDWVLRVRQRQHKHEPYYEGPLLVSKVLSDGRLILETPAGRALPHAQHPANLFPALINDNEPVRSLWYGSKRQYADQRRQIAANAGLEDPDR